MSGAGDKEDGMTAHEYDDIIDLPHHVSVKHPPMSMRQRAAQFAPFAALSGYGAAVNETARLTEQAAALDEDTLMLLDERLRILQAHMDESPTVTITCFLPDERKDGGRYADFTGAVRRIDELERVITLQDGTRIDMRRIMMLTGDIFP